MISTTEPFEDTPTGRLLEAIIESMDEFYSANLGQEVLRGMRESASRGFYVASRTPYGYRRIKVRDGNKERPKLEIYPYQAPVVARIFKEFLAGAGLKDVAKALNGEGISAPRGKRWGKTTIHGILINEAYTGTLVWGCHSQNSQKFEKLVIEKIKERILTEENLRDLVKLVNECRPSAIMGHKKGQ